MNKKLLSCPFCGNEPYQEWWDRGGQIGCKSCGYHLPFKGLIRIDKNDFPISYEHPDGSIGLAKEGQKQEYYWRDSIEEAYEKWNSRVTC